MSKSFFYIMLSAIMFSMSSCNTDDVVFDLPEDPDTEVPDSDVDPEPDPDPDPDPDPNPEPKPWEEVYSNPLSVKDYPASVILDPSIIQVDQKFYLYAASEGWTDGTRPLIAIYESNDLVNWTFVKEAINTSDYKEKIGDWLQGVYIFKDSDKYCIYFVSNNALRCFISDSPIGNFVAYNKESGDDGSIVFPEGYALGYDGLTSFIVDGGNKYMLLRNKVADWDTDLYLLEMTDYATFKTPTVAHKISDDNLQCPSLIKMNEKYYLFTKNAFYFGAESFRVFSSEQLTGTYTYTGQNFIDNSKNVNGIDAIVKDSNNDYWALYSVFVDDVQKHKLFLDKVNFDGGFPHIKDIKPSTTEQMAPFFNWLQDSAQ